MSRSGYDDDCDNWALIRWRGAVESSIRGKRGQAFLREMIAALDSLPEKKLGRGALVDSDGCPCAMGAVALARGLDVPQPSEFDDNDGAEAEQAAELLGVARALAKETAYLNDDDGTWRRYNETPEQRWKRMREWAVENLADPTRPVLGVLGNQRARKP